MLTFQTVDAALKRCLEKYPPCAPEYRMHEDANAIASVWATMVCAKLQTLQEEAVHFKSLDALARWDGRDG